MLSPQRFPACARAAVALEFAIVGSSLVFLTMGVLEVGRALYVRSPLAQAADYGVRRVLTNASVADTAVIGEVRDAFKAGRAENLAAAMGSETVSGLACRTITLT